eukprot:g10112.t1
MKLVTKTSLLVLSAVLPAAVNATKDDMKNGNCDYNMYMCCWTENDNQGMEDNTDVCYVNGKEITKNEQVDTHCHGFAWNDGDDHDTFIAPLHEYVRNYDHKGQRGYYGRIEGGRQCGCTEDMPIVERADCTTMDAHGNFVACGGNDLITEYIKLGMKNGFWTPNPSAWGSCSSAKTAADRFTTEENKGHHKEGGGDTDLTSSSTSYMNEDGEWVRGQEYPDNVDDEEGDDETPAPTGQEYPSNVDDDETPAPMGQEYPSNVEADDETPAPTGQVYPTNVVDETPAPTGQEYPTNVDEDNEEGDDETPAPTPEPTTPDEEYTKKVYDCDYNMYMCCWTENDNQGMEDNTDVCYVNGKEITKNEQVDTHCHGFAWKDDADHDTFIDPLYEYVRNYDHKGQRGYYGRIEGGRQCACTEDMPIVERADCTTMDAHGNFVACGGNDLITEYIKLGMKNGFWTPNPSAWGSCSSAKTAADRYTTEENKGHHKEGGGRTDLTSSSTSYMNEDGEWVRGQEYPDNVDDNKTRKLRGSRVDETS